MGPSTANHLLLDRDEYEPTAPISHVFRDSSATRVPELGPIHQRRPVLMHGASYVRLSR